MKKRLPIGISDFKELIENNYYFVDTSNLITDIFNEASKISLITRPRRFGKTLNISMLPISLITGCLPLNSLKILRYQKTPF